MLKGPSGTNWEFDGFKVMTDMRLLIAGGTPVPLTSKAFDTLVALIENRDRVVTKDELLRSVWPDVDVEEGNLTQQIFLLRKALGETAQQPRHIVTVPGHGYRFTARVNALSEDVAATAASSNGDAARPASHRRVFSATGLAGFGVSALLAIVLGLGWISRNKAAVPQDFTRHITRITESGKARVSAISRDGRYVAYVENDGDQVQPVGETRRHRREDAGRSAPAASAGFSELQPGRRVPLFHPPQPGCCDEHSLPRPDDRRPRDAHS